MMSSASTTKRKFVVNIEPKIKDSELSVIDAIHVPSEVIAKIFVEKIITNTVRIVNIIECENRIGEHCFKFLENNISPILALSFPLYEKDDTEHCENKDIFYSEKFQNENTWEEMDGKLDDLVASYITVDSVSSSINPISEYLT